uniref:Transmembrane protein n=1 Tax=Chromera velia CCMP2878 TaxID=1169474 RepID=A0A0G4ICS3_9ALVE|eukprot:Cvel_13236.t1-p1 / transcript=Cvel_13236.t1 / gene=Cvel_13236 / organism=Chromera_velia_CCMP2878 / gene_product=hypothetical protein / transcript_product=hypothetical protein / location=Cvel_scaffold897:11913-26945(-) / protein_length=1581 / sequence_SO=supercontig / SO=protein_coding / is_pseudo=false
MCRDIERERKKLQSAVREAGQADESVSVQTPPPPSLSQASPPFAASSQAPPPFAAASQAPPPFAAASQAPPPFSVSSSYSPTAIEVFSHPPAPFPSAELLSILQTLPPVTPAADYSNSIAQAVHKEAGAKELKDRVSGALSGEDSAHARREAPLQQWERDAKRPIRAHFDSKVADVHSETDLYKANIQEAKMEHRLRFLACVVNICHACFGGVQGRFVVPADQTPTQEALQNNANLREQFAGLDQVPPPPDTSFFPKRPPPPNCPNIPEQLDPAPPTPTTRSRRPSTSPIGSPPLAGAVQSISVTGNWTGTTEDADFSHCGGSNFFPGVWFSFRIPHSSGLVGVAVDTCSGTSASTVIGVLSGAGCSSDPSACECEGTARYFSWHSSCYSSSRVSFAKRGGSEVYIVVRPSYNRDMGERFNLTVRLNGRSRHDTIRSALDISDRFPQALTEGMHTVSFRGDWVGATEDAEFSHCGGDRESPGVWFSLRIPQWSGPVGLDVDTCSGTFSADTMIGVLSGAGCSSDSSACECEGTARDFSWHSSCYSSSRVSFAKRGGSETYVIVRPRWSRYIRERFNLTVAISAPRKERPVTEETIDVSAIEILTVLSLLLFAFAVRAILVCRHFPKPPKKETDPEKARVVAENPSRDPSPNTERDREALPPSQVSPPVLVEEPPTQVPSVTGGEGAKEQAENVPGFRGQVARRAAQRVAEQSSLVEETDSCASSVVRFFLQEGGGEREAEGKEAGEVLESAQNRRAPPSLQNQMKDRADWTEGDVGGILEEEQKGTNEIPEGSEKREEKEIRTRGEVEGHVRSEISPNEVKQTERAARPSEGNTDTTHYFFLRMEIGTRSSHKKPLKSDSPLSAESADFARRPSCLCPRRCCCGQRRGSRSSRGSCLVLHLDDLPTTVLLSSFFAYAVAVVESGFNSHVDMFPFVQFSHPQVYPHLRPYLLVPFAFALCLVFQLLGLLRPLRSRSDTVFALMSFVVLTFSLLLSFLERLYFPWTDDPSDLLFSPQSHPLFALMLKIFDYSRVVGPWLLLLTVFSHTLLLYSVFVRRLLPRGFLRKEAEALLGFHGQPEEGGESKEGVDGEGQGEEGQGDDGEGYQRKDSEVSMPVNSSVSPPETFSEKSFGCTRLVFAPTETEELNRVWWHGRREVKGGGRGKRVCKSIGSFLGRVSRWLTAPLGCCRFSFAAPPRLEGARLTLSFAIFLALIGFCSALTLGLGVTLSLPASVPNYSPIVAKEPFVFAPDGSYTDADRGEAYFIDFGPFILQSGPGWAQYSYGVRWLRRRFHWKEREPAYRTVDYHAVILRKPNGASLPLRPCTDLKREYFNSALFREMNRDVLKFGRCGLVGHPSHPRGVRLSSLCDRGDGVFGDSGPLFRLLPWACAPSEDTPVFCWALLFLSPFVLLNILIVQVSLVNPLLFSRSVWRYLGVLLCVVCEVVAVYCAIRGYQRQRADALVPLTGSDESIAPFLLGLCVASVGVLILWKVVRVLVGRAPFATCRRCRVGRGGEGRRGVVALEKEGEEELKGNRLCSGACVKRSMDGRESGVEEDVDAQQSRDMGASKQKDNGEGGVGADD